MEIAMSLNQTNWLAIALTFVMAGLFCVLISGGAVAVDYEHAVTISPTQQEGEPEDTLTYTVTIDNDGTEDDTYNLGMSSTIPTGWEMYILPSQISISDESTGTVTLYVEIGNRTNAEGGQTKQFTVYCQSAGESSNNETAAGSSKVKKIYGNSLSAGTTQISVDPNNDATFSITVVNDKGNTEDTITFSQDSVGTSDWSFTLPGSVSLDQDESATVTFSVTPDIEALAGLKSINFYANSEDGETAYSISVTVRVNQLPALEVTKVGSSAQDIEAGKRVYYSFKVTNKGNAVDSFDLSVVTDGVPTGWEASLDNDEVSSLGVDENITLTDVLVVKAPQDAAADVVATIQVKVSSQENTSVFKTFTSRSTVLQNYDPKITIVGGDTQSANPEIEVTYNLTIENEGNGEDEISLSLTGLNATWGTLGESSFTLAAGANTTTTLRVTAPEDTSAQNGYKITIKATSEDATTSKYRDVFLNVNQIYEVSVSVSGDTTQSGDPGDQLSYSITVKNKGNSDDTVALSLEGEMASWGSIVEDVDLEQGESTTVNLTVNIDEDAVVGDNIITVNGTSEDSSSAYDTSSVTVSVNKQYKVDMIVSSKAGDPGSELIYPMRVQNKGTGSDSFKLSIDDYPVNWIVQLESEYVEDVAAGSEKTVNLTITIPSGEQNQAFTTNITASSLGAADENPPKWVNTTVAVTTIVNQEYWIDLSVDSSTVDAIIGTPVSVSISVENLGTGDDIVAMSVTAPSGWTALEFNTSFLNVQEGKTGLVGLSITVPEGTEKGDYSVNVSGVSNCDDCANGTKSQDALTLTVKVELSRGVEINADVVAIEKIPGSSAVFSVDVKNTGDGTDTILISILSDNLNWVTANPAEVELAKDATATITITCALPEYDLDNLSAQERDALEDSSAEYEFQVKAKSAGDLAQSAITTLTTEIGQIYGASLTVVGSDTLITYPSTEDSANDRREKFTLKLVNTGNRNDNVNVETVATSYPDEWTVSIFTSASCSSGSFSGSIGAGESKYLYLCITPDVDSEAGNYTVITEASAGNGAEPAVQAETTLDVREPIRAVTLSVTSGEEEVTLSPEIDNEEKNTARFKITVTNTGSHDDKFTAELDNVLGSGWESDFFTKNSGNPGSSSDKWSATGQALEKDQSKSLWFIAEVDADVVDEGNYTMSITVRNAEEETQSTTIVTINIAAPTRSLAATAIDLVQEIYPEYEGSATKNSVKFKVKLDNTGSNPDIFIPETVSTLDDDWEVTYWQDSSKSSPWSTTSGLSIEDGELDDLWVFVEVADEADEGNYTIQISVRDEEDDPSATQDLTLTVIVQRPELTIQQSNILLEIDGAIGNASQVQDGDTVVILVDVENIGTADADDVRVEIFYYPKKSPETQNEIDALMIAGFELDEAKGYIKSLYDKTTNIKSNNQKTVASDDWLIEGGEWYVEVRSDYDEDNDNGEILEPNENNNDARYSELLRVKPDLAIDAMRVDTKYAGSSAQTPNVDDIVTFTVTVSNTGAADVQGARLYITADSSADNEILKDRTNKDYVDFDVDAGETTDVRFRWKATEEEWTTFRAEVNPICDDYNIQDFECESDGDGFSGETDRMFDELGRYTDNEYPRSGVFEQSSKEVKFEILPDFKIKKVAMDPRNPEVGEDVEITVTLENIGNADWQISSKPLTVVFEDGTGTELTSSVGESINEGDTTEVKFTWTVPDEDNKDELDLTFTIDAGSGSFEINQCNTCDESILGGGTDNDEHMETIPLVLPAVLGEIEFISDLQERELIKGVPLLWPFLAGVGLVIMMVAIPIVRRRRARIQGSDGKDNDGDGQIDEPDEGVPSKIGVVIVSTVDGKTANVKVPSNMPVNKLLQNCIDKFQLPHSNFAVMLNGASVDVNLSLADAGLTDSCQIDLVPLE